MATKIEEARERQEKAYGAMLDMRKKFVEQGEKWTDDAERSAWKKANEDYNVAQREVEQLEEDRQSVLARMTQLEEQERRAQETRRYRPGSGDDQVTDEHRSIAFGAWCRRQFGAELSEQELDACRRTGMRPNAAELPILLADNARFKQLRHHFTNAHPNRRSLEGFEARALAKGTTTAGGYTVPEGFVYELEQAMLTFGGVRQVAEVIRTENGQDLPWPTSNDTGNSGALLAENAQAASNVDMTFGVRSFAAYKYTSRIVLVPYELMEDSAFDMASYLSAALGERLGRIQNTACTTGTGSSQPQGIVTGSALGHTTASPTAIAADELVRLQHSVDPAYRIGAGFMMHDNIVLAIRLLKDAENRYLWQSGLMDNRPDTLLGQPLTLNQDMASTIATTNKTVLYGQLSKYKIREVREIRLRRLVERYADYDQDGFVAFLRFDGALLNAGVAPVKHLLQA